MKKELVSVELRPAKGGVISRTNMKTSRGGQGGGPSYDHNSEETVHPTMEHMQAHIGKMMGMAFPKGAEPTPEPEK
jgi:hypothetical protein